jgi:sigma-E factor negative regulatory protein RseA
MTDPIHEQLSAFLDGELSAAESELLLKRVERDPDLKLRLERYVLAGEALRATAVQSRPSRDFSSRVAAAIDSESGSARAGKYVSQWLKPIAGGAIAAGVAAMALVSFRGAPSLTTPATELAGNTELAAQPVKPVAGFADSSDSNAGSSFTVPSQQRRATPPIQVVNNGRLANFVVAHSEYSTPLGRRNALMGLVAEDVPTDQPVEQFIVEQLSIEDAVPALPQPNNKITPASIPGQPDESQRVLATTPR